MTDEVAENNSNNQPSGFNPLIIVGIVIVTGIIAYGAMMLKNNTKPIEPEVLKKEEPVVGMDQTKQIEGESSNSAMESEVKIITVEAGSFYYKPNEIRVKKGEKVKIVLESRDMMHNFNIDELGVAMPIIKSGNTGTVEFTPNQAGTFEFYCSVGQHRKNGQVGKLIVE